MITVKNDRFIKALLRQPTDRRPIWMMRQAGRYLPEYRELRAGVPDFMTFCKTPDLAAQATIQPIQRFGLDAAIMFSDILTIPDAMGLDLQFIPGEGPVIYNNIMDHDDVKQLRRPDVSIDLMYVMQTIELSKKALDNSVPLIGFAGSPWTVSCYMVEGGSSKIFKNIKDMLYMDPETLHMLLDKVTTTTTDYLNAQIQSGADAIMLFDSWGGVLSPTAYREFSLQYMQRIADHLIRERDGQKIPLIFFSKGANSSLEAIANTGCDAVGLDWTIDMADAKKRIGDKVALQGNLDPMVLFALPDTIREETNRVLTSFGKDPGHVFNLGHGINKDTPIEGVTALIDAVHAYQL